MKNSLKFKEERASHVAELEALVETAKSESRDFTETEESRQAELNTSIYSLDDKIAQSEKTEEIMLRSVAGAASKSQEAEMESHAKQYSLQDAISQFRNGNKLTGREAEMAQEAQKEYREAGITPTGHIQIPMGLTHRATSVYTTTTGTQEQSVLAGLVPESQIEQAGANRITGVSGTVRLPKLPSDATAQKGENVTMDAGSAMTATDIAPIRIASRIDVSNQMLVASTNTFDAVVASQFRKHSGGLLDAKAFANFVAAGAKVLRPGAGAAAVTQIDYASANALLGAMGDADALSNNAAFFGNHANLATARSQQAVLNGGIPTLQNDGTIAGYKAYGSSQMIADLLTTTAVNTTAKVHATGDSTTVTNAAALLPFMLVNMDDVYACYWGGADLVVDNLTLAADGITRLIMNYYANCNVGHGASAKYVAVA
jgi:HK97 family phage major capsid protein